MIGNIKLVGEHDVDALLYVYDEIVSSGAFEFFHPHEMTLEYAKKICRHNHSKDRYYLWLYEGNPIAYGMMRYFGYEVPSLGIYVCKDFRGKRIGRAMMLEMHRLSEAFGDTSIRLTVDKRNKKAISLYRSLGYSMQETEDSFVGTKSFQEEKQAEEEKLDIEENSC